MTAIQTPTAADLDAARQIARKMKLVVAGLRMSGVDQDDIVTRALPQLQLAFRDGLGADADRQVSDHVVALSFIMTGLVEIVWNIRDNESEYLPFFDDQFESIRQQALQRYVADPFRFNPHFVDERVSDLLVSVYRQSVA